MATRKPQGPQPEPSEPGGPSRPKRARRTESASDASARKPVAKVLAVDPCAKMNQEVQKALAALGVDCRTASTLEAARAAIEGGAFDLVILDQQLPDGCGLDLVRELASKDAGPRCIVTSDQSDFDGVVSVMRSGAIDFVAKPYRASEIAGRVLAAIEVARKLRDSERRVRRLKRICKRLNSARREVSKQVDVLCNDLVHAYQELADQVTSASLASDFSAVVRPELDVENLLRSTLEFLLTKTGATNTAVFLPTGSRDFNLGAYVNYDVPRETADVLLDHLADVIAPEFEDETTIVRLDTNAELVDRLGDSAGWLSDYGVVVFSCRHDGDCLAVVALFRDRNNPFPPELIPQLAIMRDIFAEQLARVVRVHHRHKPDLKWPGFDVEDDRGLAA